MRLPSPSPKATKRSQAEQYLNLSPQLTSEVVLSSLVTLQSLGFLTGKINQNRFAYLHG